MKYEAVLDVVFQTVGTVGLTCILLSYSVWFVASVYQSLVN